MRSDPKSSSSSSDQPAVAFCWEQEQVAGYKGSEVNSWSVVLFYYSAILEQIKKFKYALLNVIIMYEYIFFFYCFL